MKEAIDRDGFARWDGRIDDAALADLERLFDSHPFDRPGSRIDPAVVERSRIAENAVRMAATLIGDAARPVRALLFDKSEAANWSLGWHQDRTIEIAAQADIAGYGPYTRKQGRLHVAPPIELIEQMITLRIHLDPVDTDNAPLVVAPGSHRLGFIPERQIDAVVDRCGEAVCLAEPGTMWFYATPILHRSARSLGRRRRRVLQMDLAACALPDCLTWARDVTTA